MGAHADAAGGEAQGGHLVKELLATYLECFRDVASVNPKNWRARIGVIRSMGRSGERTAALTLANDYIAELQGQMKRAPQMLLAEVLIQCLSERAAIKRWVGRPSEALSDIDAIVVLREGAQHYLENRGIQNSVRDALIEAIACAKIDRGLIRADLKQYKEALIDLDAAARFYWNQVALESSVETRVTLAVCLTLRGSVLASMERGPEARPDLNEAVRIYRQLIESEKRHELEDNVASALAERAIALRDLSPTDQVLKDFDESVALRARLVKVGRKILNMISPLGSQIEPYSFGAGANSSVPFETLMKQR
jgi:tetratricopeptide (TPR) repeat protein